MANIAANGSPAAGDTYVTYKYLGASMVVDANHPAVPTGLRLTYAGATSGDYSGLDRFGRVAWQRWMRTGGASAADRYFYGYDRAGNRTWRAERADLSVAGSRDEAYVYDKLDRLIGAKRGILPDKPYQAPYPGDATLDGTVDGFDNTVLSLNWLGSGKTWTQADFNGDGTVDGLDNTILGDNWLADPNETVAKSWSWSLDPRGNWTQYVLDADGDGQGAAASQTRTHDNANEIQSMSGLALPPLYDQAGSNVRGPRPADPNANNAAHFRYDPPSPWRLRRAGAWNRLATIHLDDGNTAGTLDANDTLLATYRYDGLNRRVMKVTHADANTTTDYMFFNEGHGLRSLGEAGWQIVEVRRGVNQTPTAAAYKQYAWDLRYIDAPVCRWWDADADGTMEPAAGEMHYFTNDGNFNTTALVDANSGSVVERYLYDPYGKVTVLNGVSGAEKDPNVAEWSPDADNKSDWDNEVLFCGYWYDPETGLYHVRERYYDPLTGTWKTRDRILYPDGMNLYEYVRSAPTMRIDPGGTKCVVCDYGIRYRRSISSLDAEMSEGKKLYSWGARAAEVFWRNPRAITAAQYHITIGQAEASGPRDFYNIAYIIPSPSPLFKDINVEAKSIGAATFLFFVDFDVCNPDDCKVEIWEKEGEVEYNDIADMDPKQRTIERKTTTDSPWVLKLSAPPWRNVAGVGTLKVKNGQCTHRIVYTDMPGSVSFLKKISGLQPFPRFTIISADQKIVVKDKETDMPVIMTETRFSEVIHKFSIGFNKDGKMVAKP